MPRRNSSAAVASDGAVTEDAHAGVGQHPDQLARHPVGEEGLTGIPGLVFHRQHGDALDLPGWSGPEQGSAAEPRRGDQGQHPGRDKRESGRRSPAGGGRWCLGRRAGGRQRLDELSRGVEPVGRILGQGASQGPRHLGRHRGP